MAVKNLCLDSEEEEEEDEEDISQGRNSTGWIDPTTPRDAVDAGLDEAMTSEEEGFVVEAFSEWRRTPKDMWKTKVGHMGTLWLIAMMAAVMGFVLVGRRWYCLRCHNQNVNVKVIYRPCIVNGKKVGRRDIGMLTPVTCPASTTTQWLKLYLNNSFSLRFRPTWLEISQ